MFIKVKQTFVISSCNLNYVIQSVNLYFTGDELIKCSVYIGFTEEPDQFKF